MIKKIIKKIPFIYPTLQKTRNIIKSIQFKKDFNKFKNLSQKNKRFELRWKERILINEKSSGFDEHYVYHTAWAARVVKKIKPEYHTDISSSLYFSSIISAFIPVKFYDYRPFNLNLSGLETGSADLVNLPFKDNSVYSISCMHVVEHLGLGRYGDKIDPDADLKAINELKRVLAKGGNLIFVSPIGKPKLFFNAHRIYSYDQIMEYFKDIKLKEFFLIPDNAAKDNVIYNAGKIDADRQTYGCGCFWFVK